MAMLLKSSKPDTLPVQQQNTFLIVLTVQLVVF